MYPSMMELLKILGWDNGMTLKSNAQIVLEAEGTDEIEYQASTLSQDELELFAAGEHSQIEALAIGREELSSFINSAFDGSLNGSFYY